MRRNVRNAELKIKCIIQVKEYGKKETTSPCFDNKEAGQRSSLTVFLSFCQEIYLVAVANL